MKQFILAVLAAAALAGLLWLATGTDADRPTRAGTSAGPAAAAASDPANRAFDTQVATAPQLRQPATTGTVAAAVSRSADAGPVLLKELTDVATGVQLDVFGHTRATPSRVEVATLEMSSDVNPGGAGFSAEPRESIGRELELYGSTFAQLSAEIDRVEAQELAEATASGFATRKAVEIEVDENGSESFSVPIGVVGEESEIVFGDDGAEVVRAPTLLMARTNAVRAARLAEWLELWHAVLPKMEKAGHLDATQSDAIYQHIHDDFEGVLAGFDVSLEQLQRNRKKR